jgi:hypothetical protein
MIRPSKPLQRRKPSPQLAQALEQQEQKRPRTIQQQVQDIYARIELLRAATYLLILPNRKFK